MTRRSPGQVLAIGGGAAVAAMMVGIGGFKVVEATTTTTRHDHFSYTRPIHHVVIDASRTTVQIQGTPADTVTVDRAESESLQRAAAHVTVTGDTLRLTGGCGGFAIAHCSIRYTISVPSTVDITAHTSAGSLSAHGLRSNVSLSVDAGEVAASDIRGRVSLRTHAGEIVASGISGDSATLQTDAGPIVASDIASKDLQARALSGRVSLDFSAAPDSVRTRVDSGAVIISVPRNDTAYNTTLVSDSDRQIDEIKTDPTSPHLIDVQTHSGGIVLAYN